MSLNDKIHTYSLGAIGVSVFILIICFLGFIWSFVFYSSSIEGEALVTGLKEHQTDDGVLYAPVFKFSESDGKEHNVQSTHASYPPRYKIGETIKIRYKETDPSSAKPSNFFSLWGIPTVFGIFGVFLFTVGFIIERIFLRKKRRTEPVSCADRC